MSTCLITMAVKCYITILLGINVSFSVAYFDWCKDSGSRVLKCNYFPKDIPQGFFEVHIENFMNRYDNAVVTTSTFQTKNWSYVRSLKLSDDRNNDTQSLTFETKCLSGLYRLQEFHLHVQVNIRLNRYALVGVNSLKTLDFGRCGRLPLMQVTSALNRSSDLKSLEILSISRLNYHVNPLNIDRNFFTPLQQTNIKYLNISHTDIGMVRFYTLQYINTLEVINLSYSSIADMTIYYDKKAKNFTLLKNVKMLDISYYPLTKLAALFPNIISNFKFLEWDLPDLLYIVRQFLSGQAINVTGILSVSKKKVKLKNCTVEVTGHIPWLVKEIIGRQNNLNRLDAQFHCGKYKADTITSLDISENDLEFLHPSIVSCVPNLEILDLSSNLLYKMAEENIDLFEQLFNSLQHLKSLKLSANQLRFIPLKMFENNLKLIHVDLSSNLLSQVVFTVKKLKNLEVLDLRNNEIKILEQNSLTMLNSICVGQNKTKATISLDNNPLCCCKCEAELFIEWLTKTKIVDSSNLKCNDENGIQVNVSENGLETVRSICKRRKTMIISLSSAGLVPFLAIITFVIFYKSRKHQNKLRKRKCVYDQLRNGNGPFSFAAFLHYSEMDEVFVQGNIENHLNDKLKEKIKLVSSDRKLIWSENITQPGRNILKEITANVQKSSVLIIVLSNAYCSSSHCEFILECIIYEKKPMILLIKEQIDESYINPLIKNVFKRADVKLQWDMEKQEHILNQMCSSIIDTMIGNSVK